MSIDETLESRVAFAVAQIARLSFINGRKVRGEFSYTPTCFPVMSFTTQGLHSSFSSNKPTSRRPSPIPSMQVNTKLPCPEDLDTDEPSHPNYAPDDIARVQRILLHFVPAELADAIIDLAEYWPYVGTSRNDFSTSYSALDAPDANAQWCYLVSPKVPAVERNGVRVPTTVKKVKFSVKTYESSWGKAIVPQPKATPSGSKTWFEASILKNDEAAEGRAYKDDVRPNDWFAQLAAHPKYISELRDSDFSGPRVDNPFDSKQRWHVTNNPESTEDRSWNDIVWKHGSPQKNVDIDPETGIGSGSGFLDSLAVDDRIVLLARAMSPGLINTIFNVKLEIYYALSSSYL
ncbi:hypothetical protein BDN70DRAFT_886443 [Pholiota conissans]|uniref:Uncharacterized protein n=1 Tax=Pholiota conissans TaxID=109636 RepID=A0A9P5YP62_9AGAR|nr:hypothetical protein BDN70DRAFT_886443 [Pholiota conissans]